jgi:hypothetical protein
MKNIDRSNSLFMCWQKTILYGPKNHSIFAQIQIQNILTKNKLKLKTWSGVWCPRPGQACEYRLTHTTLLRFIYNSSTSYYINYKKILFFYTRDRDLEFYKSILTKYFFILISHLSIIFLIMLMFYINEFLLDY